NRDDAGDSLRESLPTRGASRPRINSVDLTRSSPYTSCAGDTNSAGRRTMYEKIVIVTRKTRLEELVERFNTPEQAKFYIEHMGLNFADYDGEHATYGAAVGRLRRELEGLAKLQVIERGFLPNFIFTPQDLVVTIGQDGLVVNAAKYLHG